MVGMLRIFAFAAGMAVLFMTQPRILAQGTTPPISETIGSEDNLEVFGSEQDVEIIGSDEYFEIIRSGENADILRKEKVTAEDKESECKGWLSALPIRGTPRLGNFPLPPTDCGYFSLVDWFHGGEKTAIHKLSR